MGMMIHRNKKKRAEKQSALLKNAEKPENYTAEVPEEQRYTKTEINRMSKAELQELAVNSGVDGAEEMTGAELKESLINLFAL